MTSGRRFVKRDVVPKDRRIRFAILIGLVAVAIRFVAINQPFIDRWSWRQSDVAAIARNYFTGGFHLAYPQIDWAGGEPGYVGTEFPILPFVAALIYKIAGVHEWVGRGESVLFFALSLPFFWQLVRNVFGAVAANWALIFYSFAPLTLMASRCFMPDMPSLGLAIIGIYLFQRWCGDNLTGTLLLSAICMALSILIKVPSAVNGAPLLYLAWRRWGTEMFRRTELWLYAAIALMPSALWYAHAYRLSQQFYPHHFFGAGGFTIESAAWYGNIFWRTASSGLTIVVSLATLFGAVRARAIKNAGLFGWWFAAMVLFVFVVGYGNRHPWYQLPFVPIAAAFAGLAVRVLTAKEFTTTAPGIRRAVVGLAFAGFAVMSFVAARGLYAPAAADLRNAGLELRRTTDPSDLIVAVDYGDPTLFYYAERKGWHFTERNGIYNGHPATDADAIADLARLRNRGATYLVFYSGSFWWLDYYRELAAHLAATSTSIKETPQFRIYNLNRR